MRILVVARGGSTNGLGHIMRSLSFASTAVARGDEVQLALILDDTDATYLKDIAPQEARHLANDSDVLALAEEFNPEVVVLDTVVLTRAVVQSLRAQGLFLASISPVFEEMDLIDVVYSRSDTQNFPPGILAKVGLRFAILGPGAQKLDDAWFQSALAEPRMGIAISFGAADPDNLTLQCLRKLRLLQTPSYLEIFVGKAYQHSIAPLRTALQGTAHEFAVLQIDQSMWGTIRNCSLAILGGGISALEAVHAGLPSINLPRSAIQRELLGELIEAKVTICNSASAGSGLRNIVEQVKDLSEDRAQLTAMRSRCKKIDLGSGVTHCLESLQHEFKLARQSKDE